MVFAPIILHFHFSVLWWRASTPQVVCRVCQLSQKNKTTFAKSRNISYCVNKVNRYKMRKDESHIFTRLPGRATVDLVSGLGMVAGSRARIWRMACTLLRRPRSLSSRSSWLRWSRLTWSYLDGIGPCDSDSWHVELTPLTLIISNY